MKSFVLVTEDSVRKISCSVHSRNMKRLKNEFTSVSIALNEFSSSTSRGEIVSHLPVAVRLWQQ